MKREERDLGKVDKLSGWNRAPTETTLRLRTGKVGMKEHSENAEHSEHYENAQRRTHKDGRAGL